MPVYRELLKNCKECNLPPLDNFPKQLSYVPYCLYSDLQNGMGPGEWEWDLHIPVCSWRPSSRCREPQFHSSSPPALPCHWAASWPPVVSGGAPGRREVAEGCMEFVLWHINTATVGRSGIESTFLGKLCSAVKDLSTVFTAVTSSEPNPAPVVCVSPLW